MATVVALGATLLSLGGVTSAAVAGPPSSISGVITLPGGAPAVGASVSVYYLADGLAGSTTTDAAGAYTVGGLQPDSYRIRFEPPFGPNLADEWWNNASSEEAATIFTTQGSTDYTGVNAQFAVGAIITGAVSNESFSPLEGIQVIAFRAGGLSDAYWIGSATTDSSGVYSIQNLPADSYTLKFRDTAHVYGQEWYSNQISNGAADFFAVSAGSTTNRGALLSLGGSVSGTVTGSDGNPVDGVTVRIYTTDGDEIYSDVTDSGGGYSIGGLGAANYALQFDTTDVPFWATEWNENQISRIDADSIALAATQALTGQDAVLDEASWISGTIYDNTDAAVGEGVTVLLYSANDISANFDSLLAVTQTDEWGFYDFDRLPVGGSYKVAVTLNDEDPVASDGSPGESPNDWVTQWWSKKYSYTTANQIDITTELTGFTGTDIYLENPHFQDAADPSSIFYPAIEWMADSAISTGTPSDSGRPLYKPLDSVSRQAMAAFLYRLDGGSFTAPATPSFADVPTTASFYTEIEWMYAEGIATGTSQPSGLPLFNPTGAVSRQAMALFLSRYADEVLPGGEPSEQVFADVPTTASTARAIEWMYLSGISTGTAQPSGLPVYRPLDPVSRQSMALFLLRLDGYLHGI